MFSLTALELRVSTTWGLGVVVTVEAAVIVVAVAVSTLVLLMLTALAGDNVGTTNDNKRDIESHNNILHISISTCR